MSRSHSKLVRYLVPIVAIGVLVFAMSGTWSTAGSAQAAPITRPTAAAPAAAPSPASTGSPGSPGSVAAGSPATAPPSGAPNPTATRASPKLSKKTVAGKLNLNTATEEQLQMLPGIGPAKAERIVIWRKRNGGFRRIADLRRVKGFGYKTVKRLEPFLDVQGESTLAAKR